MIRIAERVGDNVPYFVALKTLDVNENALQLDMASVG